MAVGQRNRGRIRVINRTRFALAIAAALALAGCASVARAPDEFATAKAALAQHIQILASAEYAGREPGTEGGRKTQAYITEALTAYGYAPGASDESFAQPVDLVRLAPGEGKMALGDRTFVSGEGALMRAGMADAAVVNSRLTVFAPDAKKPFEGALRGRVAVIFSDMLYSGDANALLQSRAEAVIILTDDRDIFAEVSRGVASDRLRLAAQSNRLPALVLLAPEESRRFAAPLAGSLDGLRQEAARREAGSWRMRNTISLEVKADASRVESANIIGKLPGRVPGSGAVLVLAHWDHLGDACAPSDAADRLCNGAVDNASGIGVMLEVARRLAASGGLDRDLYIMATTAEESGLLGAEAFALDPPVPLPTIVAAFNIDTVAIAKRGAPTTVIGWGRTPLDKGIAAVIAKIGGQLDVQEDHQRFVRRQDGWALLSRDVPAVLVSTSFGDEETLGAFLSGPYHGPGDEWRETLELGGATDDIFTHIALLEHFGSVEAYRPGER